VKNQSSKPRRYRNVSRWEFAVVGIGVKNEISKCEKIHTGVCGAFYVGEIEMMCEIVQMESFR
jgi:hypothetical protein